MKFVELKVFNTYFDKREEQCLFWFLMTLRDNFEDLSGVILYRTRIPSIESLVNEYGCRKNKTKDPLSCVR